MRQHLAVYGHIAIPRGYCRSCKQWTLVIKGVRACCDVQEEEKPSSIIKRICEPAQKRKLPPLQWKREQLARQNYRCFYCNREFGTYYKRKGRERRVVLNWDHKVPYSYSQDNHTYNIIAACSICNRFKYDKVFRTVEEAQIYVLEKWSSFSTDSREDLRNLRDKI